MEQKLRDIEEYCKQHNAEFLLYLRDLNYHADITLPHTYDSFQVRANSLNSCLEALLYEIRFQEASNRSLRLD